MKVWIQGAAFGVTKKNCCSIEGTTAEFRTLVKAILFYLDKDYGNLIFQLPEESTRAPEPEEVVDEEMANSPLSDER